MKRFLIFALCALALIQVAFAEEGSESNAEVQDGLSAAQLEALSNDQKVPSDYRLTNVSVLSVVSPVDPSDASGLKAVLLEYLGSYDPVVVEYAYQSSNGYTSYIREVQPDYVWLCSAAILLILIYCVFRLGGSLLCRQ